MLLFRILLELSPGSCGVLCPTPKAPVNTTAADNNANTPYIEVTS